MRRASLFVVSTLVLSGCGGFESVDSKTSDMAVTGALPAIENAQSTEEQFAQTTENLSAHQSQIPVPASVDLIRENSGSSQQEVQRAPGSIDPVPLPPRKVPFDLMVARAYQVILFRDPDQQGLDYYTNLLDRGVMDQAGLTQSLLDSHEHFVLTVFVKAIERLPNDAERKQFVAKLNKGASRLQVASEIEGLDEAFVRSLFQKYLHRKVETAGLEYFLNLLSQGRSRVDVEYAIKFSHEALVQVVYREVLERAPESEGLAYWVNMLNLGRVNEKTFRAAVQDSDEHFVRSTWKRFHSNVITIELVKTLVLAIQSGTSRSQVEERIRMQMRI